MTIEIVQAQDVNIYKSNPIKKEKRVLFESLRQTDTEHKTARDPPLVQLYLYSTFRFTYLLLLFGESKREKLY